MMRTGSSVFTRAHSFQPVYKEVDAVALSEVHAPTLFAEVKASRSAARAWSRAAEQLRRIEAIVHGTWSGFQLLGLCVVEDVAVAVEELGGVPTQSLPDAVRDPGTLGEPICVLVAQAEAWGRALDRGWVGDEGLLERALAEGLAVGGDQHPIASSQNPDNSAMALAFRAAGAPRGRR